MYDPQHEHENGDTSGSALGYFGDGLAAAGGGSSIIAASGLNKRDNKNSASRVSITWALQIGRPEEDSLGSGWVRHAQ